MTRAVGRVPLADVESPTVPQTLSSLLGLAPTGFDPAACPVCCETGPFCKGHPGLRRPSAAEDPNFVYRKRKRRRPQFPGIHFHLRGGQ